MATDTKTLYQSNITTNGWKLSFSPAAGELWYVDYVEVVCHGDGANSKAVDYACAVTSTNFRPAVGSAFRLEAGGDASTPSNSGNHTNGVFTAGMYVSEKQEAVAGIQDTDGATVDLIMQLRRVL
jgi:hypothetical protein